MKTRAVVFGAGGSSGTAWISGVLAGFHDAGMRSLRCDFSMGTSGGCLAAAYVACGQPLDQMYIDKARIRAKNPGNSLMAGVDADVIVRALLKSTAGLTDPGEIRRAVGIAALGIEVITEARIRDHVLAELPFADWPDRPFALVSVHAESGSPRLFDGSSMVDVVTAFTAAYAVPMIAPMIMVDGGHYMDAGIRSNENLDLAADYDEILVVSPRGVFCPQAFGGTTLQEEVAELRGRGRQIEVIEPEGDALDIVCEHMLDSAASDELASVGREHGYRMVNQLSFFAEG